MASYLSQASTAAHSSTGNRYVTPAQLHQPFPKVYRLKCHGQNKETPPATRITGSSAVDPKKDASEPENVVLKIAWYASELLGIAASAFRSPASATTDISPELSVDGSGTADREIVVETIKEDFQRSYFVTGNLTLGAYADDCEFADPAGSFKGLRRFKRNCSNFGSLIEKSNMKLMKWEDFEDKGVGHWRFSCIMSFPWRPILSATGYTEYYFDPESGKVCRHVEHWNVPKMTLLKQLLKPSRRVATKDN